MRTIAFGLLALAACGDNLSPAADAPRPIDSAPVIDGPCAVGRYVTGELLDLDSTTTALAGINNATFTQRGGTATDMTSPNGRFEMCASSTTSFLFDVDAPATHVDAIAYIEQEALGGFRPLSVRTWTLARAQSFYTSRGLTYNPAKAHVLVQLVSDGAQLTLTGGAHDAVQTADDRTTPGTFVWQPGTTGTYVLFPNVDPAGGSVALTGDYSGVHTLPVAAGTITFAGVSVVYL